MSKDSPPPPDYKGQAEATAASNMEQLKYQTNTNRPTVTTPWGRQDWTNTRSFDQQGYDAALQSFNNAQPGKQWVEGTPDSWGGVDVGMTPGTQGHWNTTGPGGTAPNKDDYYKDDGWTTSISLTPEMQRALDSQMRMQEGRSSAAEGLLGQATNAFNTPFDWGGLTQRQNTVGPRELQTDFNGDAGAYRQRAQDAITELQRPDLERRRSSEETRLANQGITQGSEAYTDNMRRVSDDENRAHLAAIAEGRNESAMMFGQDAQRAGFHNTAQGQMFGQDMSAANFRNNSRDSEIAEMMKQRGMSLNELNALLTGQQVQMPNMPNTNQAGKAAGVDYLGAATQGYEAALGASNAQNASSANTTSALTSAAMMALMAFSDERLKEDIIKVGILPSGVPVVHYRYRGRPRRYTGVIAQDVARVIPEAVSLHPSGYLMVDYSKVC